MRVVLNDHYWHRFLSYFTHKLSLTMALTCPYIQPPVKSKKLGGCLMRVDAWKLVKNKLCGGGGGGGGGGEGV